MKYVYNNELKKWEEETGEAGTDITLVRGLPGAGKTTYAEKMGRDVCVAADDHFYDSAGQYNFDPKLLPDAHQSCQDKARNAMQAGKSVAVHNTFCERWEMEPYLAAAAAAGLTVEVVSVFDGGCTDEQLFKRNTHGVPLETIEAMRERWEENWQDGNPTPPWER